MPKRAESSLDVSGLARLMGRQAGVVSRRQLLDLGASRADVRRLLARRELSTVHPGVYVDHTGRPTRAQHEWAAVLACAPAALHRESALDAHGMTHDRGTPRDRATVHVLVSSERRLTPPEGVTVERVADMARWVQHNRRPARARFEYALLKAASLRSEADAVALLSDGVQQGLTTASRLLDVLGALPRLPGRAGLGEILEDVATGTRSVLERRYLRDVERAHGLPEGARQERHDSASGVVVRDVRHAPERTLVEIDGAFGHRDAVDRWSDLQRDLDAAVDDHVTVRPGWAQVLEPCRLAGLVGAVLQRRGWTGRPRRCGPTCTIDDRGAPGPPSGRTLPRTPLTAVTRRV